MKRLIDADKLIAYLTDDPRYIPFYNGDGYRMIPEEVEEIMERAIERQSKTIKLVPMTGDIFISHVTDAIIKQEQIKEQLIYKLAKTISNNGDIVMKISKTPVPEYGGVKYRADVVFVDMSEVDYTRERSINE